MTTLKQAWEMQEEWGEGDQDAQCLLDLRRRVEALEALEQQRAATEPAQEWIERRIYKNSIEYSEYIKQRFQDRTSLSFVFDGHRWQYRYSSFDDAGDYDLIFRPSVPKPAPAPAADRPLWEMMDEAYNLATTSTRTFSGRYAAEIDAVAERLEEHGYHNAGDFLRTEARRAREQ